ncbi:hypothetical protein [Hymenobacter cheonanensis]|uniref:hypothetical protein n=1 Tax=Hymenobacter sp. CA2-7 TaxID=3063993 RepID=UPI0027125F0D|nr:hypothetical protein [Hymenobacter sp. CA2-7]MDO7884104.1 hypothetical protein [Hymenobacter sp. CA2-7]
MSHRADRAAWWPTAVAGLLMAGGCGWLLRTLPPPPQPAPLARAAAAPPAAATAQPAPAAAPDTIRATADAAAAPAVEPPQAIPADTAIRFATYDPLAGDTLARPLREHRYVGTLGGRVIVVQLSVGAHSVAGSWYYRAGRQPHERSLTLRRQHGGLVVLAEEENPDAPADADTTAAEWQLRWPLGRVLAGQRRAVRGAGWLAAQLREDYSQAVPYQLLRLTAHGNYCPEEPGRSQPYYSSQFIRVLSADSLRLAQWQAPRPAARRDSLRRWLLSESCQQVSQTITVTLNDYGLLSYNEWMQGYYYGAHPEHDQTGFIIDLRTGREWLAEELLRPGTEPALRKLLARHLRHDYPELNEDDNWHWQTVPPLPGSFTLTPSGLCAGYGDYALAAYAASYANTTTIPYAELRPLVRPGTPLARMLRARGLW